MIDLSIAIVSYNTKDVLLDCLRSVHAHTTAIALEVIVVDNDSRDGTVAALKDAYPAIRIVENPDNRGFAKAVNQALAVSRGRHVLLLNSDTVVMIVPLGDFHISLRLNSLTRASSGVIVAHLTATPYCFVAFAESIVT